MKLIALLIALLLTAAESCRDRDDKVPPADREPATAPDPEIEP